MEKTLVSHSEEIRAAEEAWLDVVRRLVTTLQYGSVNIVVHDARVTQIERIERVRLGKGAVQNQTSL